MLHILNKPPQSDSARQLLSVVGEGDDVVLIEQGVQACLTPQWTGFEQCQGRIYLLMEDLATAGLKENAERHALPTLNVGGLVALTEQHEQSVTWY